LTAYFWQK